MFLTRAPFACLALLASAALAQGEQDRLLPDSFARTVGMQWKQDGRVIDITISNPNEKWLITEATFTVEYPARDIPPAASSPSKRKPAKPSDGRVALDDLLAQGYRFTPEPTTYKLKMQVFPGRTATAHIELRDASDASGLRLDEARGREPTVVERLKSKVQ